MRPRFGALCLALLASVGAGALPQAAPVAEIAARIDALTAEMDYRHAHWGILAADLQSGDVIYQQNADRLFVPASTTKLYSVAAALGALGADYRFKTVVARRGEVKEGRLEGDLILVASGDLTLGGRTTPDGRIAFQDGDHTYANGNDSAAITSPDPLAGLDELAAQVAQGGISRIRDVLVDDRLFEATQSTGSGPGTVTPILVNDNLVDVVVTPAEKAGEPAGVEWRPRSAALAVDARVDTTPAGGGSQVTLAWAGPGRLVVRGTIAAGRKPLLRVREVEDPASWARALLIEALQRKGVRVEASPLGTNDPSRLPARDATAALPAAATLTSPPFRENARLILKVSHNLHASTLPLLLAVKHGKRTLREGLRLQSEFLRSAGVPVETISFGGGAGGDRADMTTPRATVALLRHMARRPDFPVYEEALPILGVDGTLASVVGADSPAKGHVRAKTGTYAVFNSLNDRLLVTSKALAGYATTRTGRRLAFAAFVNNTHVDSATGGSREGRALGRLAETLFEVE